MQAMAPRPLLLALITALWWGHSSARTALRGETEVAGQGGSLVTAWWACCRGWVWPMELNNPPIEEGRVKAGHGHWSG